MADEQLFGRAFTGPSWGPWRVALAAIFGLGMDAEQLALYAECTGRTTPPTERAREAWLISGRRSGKSLVSSLVAAYIGTFLKFRGAPGERPTVAIVAADRDQARVCLRYVVGLLDGSPILARMVTRKTASSVELKNGVVIEVHTSSFRSTRGYSFAAVIADEVAFWRS